MFSFVGLQIFYTVDLDRVKTVSGTDSFRRMFFIDEETNGKVFVVNGFHNLTKQAETACSQPRTVFLKVSLIQCIYPRFLLKIRKFFFQENGKMTWLSFLLFYKGKKQSWRCGYVPFIRSWVWFGEVLWHGSVPHLKRFSYHKAYRKGKAWRISHDEGGEILRCMYWSLRFSLEWEKFPVCRVVLFYLKVDCSLFVVKYFFVSQILHVEVSFQLRVVKREPKLPLWPITKNTCWTNPSVRLSFSALFKALVLGQRAIFSASDNPFITFFLYFTGFLYQKM